jgi:hypothetical protein
MTFEVLNSSLGDDLEFDLFVFAVGYEERSRFLAQKFRNRAKLTVGYVFEGGHILSFQSNLSFLKDVGGVEVRAGRAIGEALLVERDLQTMKGTRVAIDVSSLNRGAMAELLSELLDSPYFFGCEITVLYAVAAFSPPPNVEMDFLDFGPLDGYGGWTTSPENPAALLVGLGYETDHAIGAFEYLDPSVTFAFFPLGPDERFVAQVEKANATFLELIPTDRVVRYPVLSPYQTFWQMRSLLLALNGTARTVVVPMGPKIFCSLCLVCQKLFGDEISVWRASGHSLENARDAVASGEFAGYVIKRVEAA